MRRQQNEGSAAINLNKNQTRPVLPNLPIRYRAELACSNGEPAQVSVELGEELVVIERHSAENETMTDRIPMNCFSAVTVRIMLAEDGACAPRLELQHADAEMTVPLPMPKQPDDLVAAWRAWGNRLLLPLHFIDTDEVVAEVESRIGAVINRQPLGHRRGSLTRGRRPQILRRRRAGVSNDTVVHGRGREIIARS